MSCLRRQNDKQTPNCTRYITENRTNNERVSYPSKDGISSYSPTVDINTHISNVNNTASRIPAVPKVPTSRWCGRRNTQEASTQYQEPIYLEKCKIIQNTSVSQNGLTYFSPQPSQKVRYPQHSSVHSHCSTGSTPVAYSGAQSIRAKIDHFYFDDTSRPLLERSRYNSQKSFGTPSSQIDTNYRIEMPQSASKGDEAVKANNTPQGKEITSPVPVVRSTPVGSTNRCGLDIPDQEREVSHNFQGRPITDNKEYALGLSCRKSLMCCLSPGPTSSSRVHFQMDPSQQQLHMEGSKSPSMSKRNLFLDGLIESPVGTTLKEETKSPSSRVLHDGRQVPSRVSEQFSDYGASIVRKFEASVVERNPSIAVETLPYQSPSSLVQNVESFQQVLDKYFYRGVRQTTNQDHTNMQSTSFGGTQLSTGDTSVIGTNYPNARRDEYEMKGYKSNRDNTNGTYTTVDGRFDRHSQYDKPESALKRGEMERNTYTPGNRGVHDDDRSINIVISSPPSNTASPSMSNVEVSVVPDWTDQNTKEGGFAAVADCEIEININPSYIAPETPVVPPNDSPSLPMKRYASNSSDARPLLGPEYRNMAFEDIKSKLRQVNSSLSNSLSHIDKRSLHRPNHNESAINSYNISSLSTTRMPQIGEVSVNTTVSSKENRPNSQASYMTSSMYADSTQDVRGESAIGAESPNYHMDPRVCRQAALQRLFGNAKSNSIEGHDTSLKPPVNSS
eukprot:Tbor_TRINITY_DN2928_c0_g2::TRINITY_DN2928_c0_g2_i1::g.1102::m.1102